MLKDHTDIGGSSPPASAANAKLYSRQWAWSLGSDRSRAVTPYAGCLVTNTVIFPQKDSGSQGQCSRF